MHLLHMQYVQVMHSAQCMAKQFSVEFSTVKLLFKFLASNCLW